MTEYLTDLYYSFINWFFRIGKKKKKRNFIDYSKDPNRRRCAIWIEKRDRKILLETYLPANKVPAFAYPVDWSGLTHLIGLDKKGYFAIDINSAPEGMSPPDIFEARSCQGPVYEVWGFDMSMGEKLKIGAMVLIIVVIIVLSFFIVNQLISPEVAAGV